MKMIRTSPSIEEAEEEHDAEAANLDQLILQPGPYVHPRPGAYRVSPGGISNDDDGTATVLDPIDVDDDAYGNEVQQEQLQQQRQPVLHQDNDNLLLVEASVVVEPEAPPVYEATQIDVQDTDATEKMTDDEAHQRRRRRQRFTVVICILVPVVVGVALAVALAAVLQGSNSGSTSNSPTADPSNTNPTSPRVWTPEQLKEFVIGELGTSKQFVEPGFTPAKASYDLIVGGGVFDNVTLGTRLMDAFVILALWAGTGGQDGWTRSDGWNQNPYPCTWYGISCNREGRVAKIMVPGNNLNGKLNLDVSHNHVGLFQFNLALLPNLVYLNLSENVNNGFTIGDVTNYNLTRLQVLDVSSNVLTGTISSQIAQLMNLRELHLQSNVLTGTVPTEIASLKNLVSLQLENNQITGTVPLDVCTNVENPNQQLLVSVDCGNVNCTCCMCGSR